MKQLRFYALLLAGATALVPVPALAQPQAIAALIIPYISTAGVVGALGFTGTAALALGIGYAVTAAALFGLQLGIQSFMRPDKPATPKPEDGKFNLKQAVPYLPFVLGEVRKGGDYVLLEEAAGIAHHITVHAGHRIKGYKEHWLHDEPVTLDEGGGVTVPEHFVVGGDPKVLIESRRGLDAETTYSPTVDAFPAIWTADHRGDGLASVLVRAKTVSMQSYQKVFPNQMPQHTAVIEGNDQLFDPRTNTSGYSTNIALFRLWHLTHPVGGKLTLDDMYLPEWENAANVCDQVVTNRDAEAEPRYHGGFWFRANNDPVEVGRLMDQAAEMVVYERPDGTVGVHAGEFVTPDIRLTENDIIALSFDTNRRKSSNVLAVKGQYTSKEAGFVTVDAAPYGDPYAAGDDTQRTRTLQNQIVQSHNHMARLEKITYQRANAPRVTVVAHYHAAEEVPYRRFVRVHAPPRLNEAVVEIISSPKLSLRNLTIEFQGIVVPSTLYAFNPVTDEGAPGNPVIPVAPTGVPVPENFDVAIETEVVSGGGTAAFATGSWDFVSDALTYEMEYEPTAGGTVRTVFSVEDDSEVRSLYLVDGEEYRFRLRAWSGGQPSGWTDYVIRTATADPVAPGVAVSVSGTGGAGEFTFDFTAPNSPNYFASLLYLNTADNFGTATLVTTEYGSANDVETRTVSGLSPDTYFGWVVAINASGRGADPVATGAQTVT